MSPAELALVLGAGVMAGTINTIVGSGSLVTFPLLVALGLTPVEANISSKLGILPGGASGTWGYRRHLPSARGMLVRLMLASAVGGLAGALLLLVLPATVFDAVVPVLIGAAGVLVVTQPFIKSWLARRREHGAAAPSAGRRVEQGDRSAAAPAGHSPRESGPGHLDAVSGRDVVPWGLILGLGATGVYSGYFGAAQGVMYMAVLGLATAATVQQQNALKNLLALVSNAVSALVFVVIALDQIDWVVVLLLSVGSAVGGLLGARVGQALSPWAIRGCVAVICVLAVIDLVR
ncbi:sulfite exporter TauE/SafE family protein [Kytococcus sp. Marseille-QA3725]